VEQGVLTLERVVGQQVGAPGRQDRVDLHMHVLDLVLQPDVDVLTERLHVGHLHVGDVLREVGGAVHLLQSSFSVFRVYLHVDLLQIFGRDVLVDDLLVVDLFPHGF